MNGKDHDPDQEGRSIISLIQSVKDRTRNPKTLSEDERRACVEFLCWEGYTQAQIGQILKICDRTVRRDLKAIEDKNAISPDVDLAKRIIGDMFCKAKAHHSYLMRLARNPEASHSEKSQAEFLAWRVLKEMVEKMQVLGYLPSKPQAIVGEIFHHVDSSVQDISLPELKAMVADIINTAKETNTMTPELEQEAETLRIKIEKTEVISQVKNLKEKIVKREE